MPTVSVCLPVYNGAKYLASAIDSVLKQTYENFELLISNDCSTDGTTEIIETYARQDKRIQAWTNAKNLGHYFNYNACLEKASGKYIKLFAQDDLLHPHFLDRFVSVMNENPKVTLINCGRCWIDARGHKIKIESELDLKLTKPFPTNTYLVGKEAISSTLKEITNWLGEPSSQMFRSEFVDGGFDTSFKQIGDLEYNYRLLQRGDYYFIADDLCYFRKHPDSWTTSNSVDLSSYLDWLLLASKYREYLPYVGLNSESYCLNFIKAWTRNLECELNQNGRFQEQEIGTVLRELCGKVDPLSLFDYPKNAERNLASEYKALGALALLQTVLLEHELRLIHREAARPYTEMEINLIPEVRSGLVEALFGLKETLRQRDNEIELLRLALSEMGNSMSWKVTEPLRKIIGRGH